MENKSKRMVSFIWLKFKPAGLLIVLQLLSLSVCGQRPQSRCYVHFDKSYYTSGEIAWYKIYLAKDFDGLDITFESNLVDSSGHQVQHYFLENNGDTYLNGYFKIPFDLRSGMYYLMLFGTDSSNHEHVKILEAPIPIYNDLLENESFAVEPARKESNDKLKTDLEDLQIKIMLVKDSLHRRSTVEAIISVMDSNGNPMPANLSISVSDSDLLYGDVDQGANVTMVTLPSDMVAGNLKNGLHVKGQIRNELNHPTKINILGYYSAAEQKLQYSPTDDLGKFFIDIKDFIGSKSIQFIDYESKDIKVHIGETYTIDSPKALTFDQNIQRYLLWSRQRKKTYQLFQAEETPLTRKTFEFNKKILRDYRTIRPDEYVQFESFPEFLNEVYLKMQLLKQGGDSYKADFFVNRHGALNVIAGPPLFFIDGKMTRDANLVAALALEQIDKIDFFHQLKSLQQQFGLLGKDGVAMITTKSGKFQLKPDEEEDIIQIHGLLPATDFPIVPVDLTTPDPQPFLRPQLYWNPSLNTDHTGKASFTFVQSDDLSTFCIEVVAHGKNGSIGVSQHCYRNKY